MHIKNLKRYRMARNDVGAVPIADDSGHWVRYEDFEKLFCAARGLMGAPRRASDDAEAVLSLWLLLEEFSPRSEEKDSNGATCEKCGKGMIPQTTCKVCLDCWHKLDNC